MFRAAPLLQGRAGSRARRPRVLLDIPALHRPERLDLGKDRRGGATARAGSRSGGLRGGADSWAFERLAPGSVAGGAQPSLPVHRILLVGPGIHIAEHLSLDEIATTAIAEFVVVLAPLRVVGAPIRPLALLSR